MEPARQALQQEQLQYVAGPQDTNEQCRPPAVSAVETAAGVVPAVETSAGVVPAVETAADAVPAEAERMAVVGCDDLGCGLPHGATLRRSGWALLARAFSPVADLGEWPGETEAGAPAPARWREQKCGPVGGLGCWLQEAAVCSVAHGFVHPTE